MKKLLSLTMLVLCVAVAMAQLVHVSTAEASECDMVKTEQHTSHEVSVQTDKHDTQTAKKFCCESCHIQLVAMPLISVKAENPIHERIVAVPVRVTEAQPDTLSKPPRA